jgi:nucleoside 2-deoxyribosyltransferase
MARCFVIQPFDGGMFDKRYDDVLKPAIEAAGLEAYRVDRDPGVAIPIESIEKGIRDSDLCLAEITSDNPNVWFELGFAIACGKDVVLVCAEHREKPFPFDVQHRHVITYRSDAPSDFNKLSRAVTERLLAAMQREQKIAQLADSPLIETEGLDSHEITALVTVMESGLDPDSAPSAYAIKTDMNRAGFTDVAAVLAIKKLQRLGMVDEINVNNFNNDYLGFVVTERGEGWLMRNQSKLSLRRHQKNAGLEDDSLPF